jgi:adenine phosphoribosyltransferase
VPVRKSGKLPGPSLREDYTLEYGSAVLEMHEDALAPGQRALVVDDVLATGGTIAATCRLVERAGATVAGIDVVLELTFLDGRAQVGDRPLHAIAPL